MFVFSVRRAIGVLVIILVVALAGLTWWVEVEVVSPVTTIGAEQGQPRALVVVHPGLGGLQQAVTTAFTAALAENGWRVDQVTPSPDAPSDVGPYDLLVFGGPTYYWSPPRPLTKYVRRLGDLQEKPVAIIMTSAGAGERCLRLMRQLVERQQGSVRSALMLFVLRPNRDDPISMARPNREVAIEMAAESGREIALAWHPP